LGGGLTVSNPHALWATVGGAGATAGLHAFVLFAVVHWVDFYRLRVVIREFRHDIAGPKVYSGYGGMRGACFLRLFFLYKAGVMLIA
jgi:hypothetical protein